MTCVTSWAGTANLSGAPEFTPFFSGVHIAQSLVLLIILCPFSFDHCIVSFDLQLLITSLLFGIFKLFLSSNFILKHYYKTVFFLFNKLSNLIFKRVLIYAFLILQHIFYSNACSIRFHECPPLIWWEGKQQTKNFWRRVVFVMRFPFCWI
jgi:hypothetical protein